MEIIVERKYPKEGYTIGSLVGKNTQVGRVTDSRRTLAKLISIIRQAQNNGETVQIIINN